MPPFVLPRLISCDEAGFTGNDMLNPEQPHFSYASHDLELTEAQELIRRVRATYRIQMPELKSSKLLKTNYGRALLSDVLDQMHGRYITSIYHKRLSLTCKLFEYIYEPVLQHNNALFYKNNLHRFVAMYLYILVIDRPIEDLAREFEAFMRSLDPTDAPTLFGSGGPDADPLVGQILRFARGYNVVIAQETRALQRTGDTGKWVLDLTVSAIFSHLAAWGERYPLIEVVCDDSKPLLALADTFNVMINRPDRAHMALFGKRRPITWNMSQPIAFASSSTHAGIQIADLIAGVTAAAPFAESRPELQELAAKVAVHLHDDCIMPDFDVLDLEGDQAPVNWLVLEALASRADAGEDPLDGWKKYTAWRGHRCHSLDGTLAGLTDRGVVEA
ncbi:MAG TPA: DUF3800 domain-containing protein [Beijerinckiaceae bacterium]|jgi:hypothetical protein